MLEVLVFCTYRNLPLGKSRKRKERCPRVTLRSYNRFSSSGSSFASSPAEVLMVRLLIIVRIDALCVVPESSTTLASLAMNTIGTCTSRSDGLGASFKPGEHY